MVMRGRVHLKKGGVVIREFNDKAMLGGGAMSNTSISYDIEAVEPTETLRLPVSALFELFEEHFDSARGAIAGMSTEVLSLRKRHAHSGGFSGTDWEADGQPPAPMNLVERIAYLRKTITFVGSGLESLADLARECQEERIPAGDVLWREGNLGESFLMVVWGVVEGRSSDGFVNRFGPGDSTGFLDAMSGSGRWYEARAETELVVLRLSTESLLDVLEDHFDVALGLIRVMADGMIYAMETAAHAALEEQNGA